ncbi:MAG: hypothetical protein AABX71_01800 [Nanoarchaeota archaeon]|mgnify:CR=1 FL=1
MTDIETGMERVAMNLGGLVGLCKFCTLGKEGERGVVRKGYPLNPNPEFPGRAETHTAVTYKCGLGKIGENCILPKLAQMAYEGTR